MFATLKAPTTTGEIRNHPIVGQFVACGWRVDASARLPKVLDEKIRPLTDLIIVENSGVTHLTGVTGQPNSSGFAIDLSWDGKQFFPNTSGEEGCACPDWTGKDPADPTKPARTNSGYHAKLLCKHMLATIAHLDVASSEVFLNLQPVATPTPIAPKVVVPAPPVEPFSTKLLRAIAKANQPLADWLTAQWTSVNPETGCAPNLLVSGPTACGKTFGGRQWAVDNGWSVELEGMNESYAPADIVGLRQSETLAYPGLLARALTRARSGEKIVRIVDELARGNSAIQALFLQALTTLKAAEARSQGLLVDEPVVLLRSALWSPLDTSNMPWARPELMCEWAPAQNIRFLITQNPWGSVLDAALISRCTAKPWGYHTSVSKLFSERIRGLIEQSWASAQAREVPVGMDYRLLLWAKGPDDADLVLRYWDQLMVADSIGAARSFRPFIDAARPAIQIPDQGLIL